MKAIRIPIAALGGLALPLLLALPASSHPEFQKFIREKSGKAVDCAICHVNGEGPEGTGPGQIGSLRSPDFDRLNAARGAFEPGQDVHSPILNAFGNSLLKRSGKTRILAARQDPAQLLEGIDPVSDLDDDGVPDVQELREGTHPLLDDSGNPIQLFWHGLKRLRFHVFMMILATLITLYGLNHLFHGLEQSLKDHDEARR